MSAEAIATLNAIVRMDASGLDAGVAQAKQKLTGFEKGVNRAGFSAEKFGRSLASRMLSAGLAVGVVTSAVNKLNDAWRDAQMNAGLPGIQVSRTTSIFQGTRDFFEGIPAFGSLVKLGGNLRAHLDGSAAALERLNKQATAGAANMKRLEEAAALQFTRRSLDARIADVIAGDTAASEKFRRATVHPDIVDREIRLEGLSETRSRFDSLMDGMKTSTDRWTESIQTLKDALKEGIIPSLKEYEQIVSRLNRSSGKAVEINTRTAIREGAAGRMGSGGAGLGSGSHAVLVEIRDALVHDNATARLR